ncbi:hypothetical protein WL19_03315 [Burkholderia ubonensis]|nr:hypothetical protein WL19_03315 [Burkholderia ubonensis]
MGVRWTRWGARHLAAISAYEGGYANSDPSIGFMVDADLAPGFYFRSGGRGTYSGSWTQASDYRVKTNVEPMDGNAVLASIMALRPVEYNRVEDSFGNKRFPGFIAHEIQQQFPLIVTGQKDAMKEMAGEDVQDLQSVDYISYTAYLTAALQAAVRRIEALERISAQGAAT